MWSERVGLGSVEPSLPSYPSDLVQREQRAECAQLVGLYRNSNQDLTFLALCSRAQDTAAGPQPAWQTQRVISQDRVLFALGV